MARIQRIEIPVPFATGSTNCYYIPGSIPTLIDTGINTSEALRSLQDGLGKFGAGISDIRRIILTHGHSDHAGSAGVVAAMSKAPVFVHYRDKDWALSGSEEASRKNERFFRGFFQDAGVPKEIATEKAAAILDRFRRHYSLVRELNLLKGGELFSFDLFKLKVIHSPGHTAGSISLFDDSEGVLVSGDCLIETFVPYLSAGLNNPEDLPPYYMIEQYERSLNQLIDLPVRLVLPGHGAPFYSHRKLIEKVKRYRARRRQRILEILTAKNRQGSGMSQYEVVKRLFSGKFIDAALFMAVSEVRGYLETMEKEGLVRVTVKDGKRLFHPN